MTPEPAQMPKRSLSLPVRMLFGTGKTLGLLILTNLGAAAVLALLYSNEIVGPGMRSWTYDRLADGFGWMSPVWDFAVAHWSKAVLLGGPLASLLVGMRIGRRRKA